MEIKDYLHFYIGQQVLCSGFEYVGEPQPNVTAIIDSVSKECVTLVTDSGRGVNDYWYDNPEFKMQLILRNLSDITEDEMHQMWFGMEGPVEISFEDDKGQRRKFDSTPAQVVYMLKQGFDLFGLIPAGLAIDKTSLKN